MESTVITLLKEKNYLKLFEKLIALDGDQLDKLFSSDDVEKAVVSSSFIPFILKDVGGCTQGVVSLLRSMLNLKQIFDHLLEKKVITEVLQYVIKNGEEEVVDAVVEQYSTFLLDSSSIQIRDHLLSILFDFGRDLILEKATQQRGYNILLPLVKKDVSILKQVGRDSLVVQACWDLLKENIRGRKGHIIDLLLLTENLGEDVGACVMSSDIGQFLLQQLFPTPVVASANHFPLREILAHIVLSPYYHHFREKHLDVVNSFYEKALPLLKNKDQKVRVNAADIVQLLANALENKKDTLGTPIFYELLEWVFSDDPQLYFWSIQYLTRITKLTEEAQLTILQNSSVIKRIFDNLFVMKYKYGDDLELFELMLLVNLSQHEAAKTYLPIEQIESKLEKILTGQNYTQRYKSRAFRIISTISDSDKIATMKLNSSIVAEDCNYITKILCATFDVSQLQYLFELVYPMANFSVNDHNKEILGQAGAVEPLLKVVSITSPSTRKIAIELPRSRRDACKTLWNMAFSENNKRRIKAANGIEILTTVAQDPKNDPVLIENAKGVLWMFGIKLDVPKQQRLQKTNSIYNNNSATQQLQIIEEEIPHIMISYNWGVQTIVLKLAAALKAAGYKVWLDIEQMKGSTLEAMAEAIEGSALVLICMTERYKESPNCRLEGEYCSQQKKPFIPLLLQEHYKPNGWLGILLGARLYHNFSTEVEWDNKIAALVHEIGDRGKEKGNKVSLSSSIVLAPAAHAHSSVASWTFQQVLDWLTGAAQLDTLVFIFEKHKIDGKCLSVLTELSHEFNNFNKFVKKDLEINNPSDRLRLYYEIKKLQ